MPSYSQRHSAPTFLIDGVKGWNTRQIYNYYGNSSYTTLNYITEAGNYSTDLFSVINSFENTNTVFLHKGITTFPTHYFKAGKSIRVRGYLKVTNATTIPSIFNMVFYMNNSAGSATKIGSSNDGSDHLFARGNLENQIIIINFETTIFGIETISKPSVLYMAALGYFQYNMQVEGEDPPTNMLNAYVPIYSNGMAIVDSDISTSTYTNTLQITFDGSSDLTGIYPLNLTIEELE
jgi:hypothetical protein